VNLWTTVDGVNVFSVDPAYHTRCEGVILHSDNAKPRFAVDRHNSYFGNTNATSVFYDHLPTNRTV